MGFCGVLPRYFRELERAHAGRGFTVHGSLVCATLQAASIEDRRPRFKREQLDWPSVPPSQVKWGGRMAAAPLVGGASVVQGCG